MVSRLVYNVQRCSRFFSVAQQRESVWIDRCLHTSSSAATFTFASASSGHGNFYKAIEECVSKVEQQINPQDIDFCQLLVSTKHVSTMAHAPQCLLDNINRSADLNLGTPTPPVIIGGALQSVCSSGSAAAAAAKSAPGVSLLAASLPGVELMPFHVKDASLPPFTAQQWAKLLQARASSSSSSSSSSSKDSSAAVVLSAPHFTDVELFLQRLSGALPNMPVVGGVTERDAWIDTENHYGALFCGTDVHCNGAVGVIMQGPLVMRHVLLQCGRPRGRVMTVTEAAGNVILALDNRPVHDSFVELLHSLPKSDQRKELRLGIYDSSIDTAAAAAAAGDGSSIDNSYVARSMSLTSDKYGRPVLAVAAHEVAVGSRVQLLVWDYETNYQQQQQTVADLAQQLATASPSPPAAAAAAGAAGSVDPQQLAVLSYCCVALPFSESTLLADQLPGVAVGGGRMQGEFAGQTSSWRHVTTNKSAAAAAAADTAAYDPVANAAGLSFSGAKLHSYAASFALLHHEDLFS